MPTLRTTRERAGIAQQELARRVGVARQTLAAIEAGRQQPSVGLALALARSLGSTVEALFASEDAPPPLAVRGPSRTSGRARVARVGEAWVAHALDEDGEAEGRAADGVFTDGGAVRLFEAPERAGDNVLVAGCAPALGALCDRMAPPGRFLWLARSSGAALRALADGLVHVAGAHGDADTLAPEIARAVAGPHVVVTLLHWEAGLVVPRGNPKGLRPGKAWDPRLRWAVRERGAGARAVLRRVLEEGGAALSKARSVEVASHQAVAQAVALGAADCGVAVPSAARALGLDFVPVREERFDVVVRAGDLDRDPRLARFVDALQTHRTRDEIASLACSARETGSVRESAA